MSHWQINNNYLLNLVGFLQKYYFFLFRIPDSIGKDIEKACQGIYPLHDVLVRKVKILKKPKFDRKLQLLSQTTCVTGY